MQGVGRKYSGKVLLFGEYVILQGSEALAVPSPRFSLCWTHSYDEFSHQVLTDFFYYLKEQSFDFLDLNSLEKDLKNRIFMASNIPVGYGLGSSGAFVAAIYDRYMDNDVQSRYQLQSRLAKMEAYFHGNSSGLDPLISYLDKGILVKDEEYRILSDFDYLNEELEFFLLDTGIARSTAPLVDRYKKMCTSESFLTLVQEEIMVYNQNAISAIIDQDWKALWSSFSAISRFQFEYMRDFIPKEIYPYWESKSFSTDIKLKFCGAGGGGFFLGLKPKNCPLEGVSHEVTFLP